jgi:DNA-binding GntR family transcriptional regulator
MSAIASAPAASAADGSPLSESLAEQAYRKLEEMIVTLELKPGAQLTEAALGAKLELGRTPVREALQRLASEHLILISPRRGVVVAEVNVEQQLMVLEVRRELERLIARRAALRATQAERARLREMAAAMKRAGAQDDWLAFLRVDRDFNQFIAQCAHNPYAARAIAPLHALSRRFWYLHYMATGDLPFSAEAHIAIMQAVADGDPKAAEEAADRLIDFAATCSREHIASRF